jgi:hypothetical protein
VEVRIWSIEHGQYVPALRPALCGAIGGGSARNGGGRLKKLRHKSVPWKDLRALL